MLYEVKDKVSRLPSVTVYHLRERGGTNVSLIAWPVSCSRCRRSFETRLESPPGARWYVARVPSYCPDCEPAWSEAVRGGHYAELERALQAGELAADQHGHGLSARELLDLAQGRMEEFPVRLAEAGVALIPLDWWHGHATRVVKELSEQGWWWRPSQREEPILLQAVADEQWIRWTRPATELPHAAVMELFQHGEVRHVIEAMYRRRHQRPRGHRRLCQAARERLTHPEPKTRFAALYVLMCVDPNPALTEFLDIASDPGEHPRVRGLAVEALKECEKGVWFRGSRHAVTRRTWKALTGFILDPEPEVRWWACFIVGLMNSWCGPAYQQALMDSLSQVVDDSMPAGLGWSVGKAAQDALDSFAGREPPDRLCNSPHQPYDPWGLL